MSYGKTHFVITRHGKETAVIISFEEYQLIEKALEDIEDALDIKDAKAVLKEIKRTGTKPLQQVAEEMGIDISAHS